MARRDETPRDLLFGLLALQNGLIAQEQLLNAFRAWSQAKGRTLAEILVERGSIDEEGRAILSKLAEKQLKLHGGDTERSLAAVPTGPSTREKLDALGDSDLSVALSMTESMAADDDPYRTASHAVGSSTSDGLRFRILRPHAKGGLGAVSVALDGELNREVALKEILERHADDPSSQARFLVEAEITGGLEHPGIVPVYGLGRYGDGRPYYAMRFIRGDSLKEAIAAFHEDPALRQDPGKRSLALRKLLRRFIDVCNAVDYAHGRGVLHRDIKPSNIILGKHGETLVVDWGLAKALGSSGRDSDLDERTLTPSASSGSGETLPGSAIGTPAYMSPEQAAGDLGRLGPRSDIYSLGATLHSLLTGKPPFEGNDLGTILRDVQRGAFPKPRQSDPSIDRALEAVCLKAMATRPEDRHATARALADDVERWAAEEPVSAWREPASARARRWMRRHHTAVTAASAAVMMAGVGLAGVLLVQSSANATLRAKNTELDRANAREAAANDGLREANARVQARFDLAREAIRAFQDGVTEDDMLKGENLKGLRDKLLRSAAGFYEKLETMLKGQADRPSRTILAQSYYELGGLTEQIGNKPEALALHRKALALRRELAAEPDADPGAKLDLARSLIAIGLLIQSNMEGLVGAIRGGKNIGDDTGALSAFEEARDLATMPASGPDPSGVAREVLGQSYISIVLVLDLMGRPAEKIEPFSQALAIFSKLAEDRPDVTRFRSSLAFLYVMIGKGLADAQKFDDCLESCRKALAIYRKLAEDNPADNAIRSQLVMTLFVIGVNRSYTRHPAEALASFRECVAIGRKLAEDNPAVTQFQYQFAVIQSNIGTLQSRTDPAEALDCHREALAILSKLARDNPTVTKFRNTLAVAHNDIGTLLAQTGHPAEALASIREALPILQKLADDDPAAIDRQQALAVGLSRAASLGSLLGDSSGAIRDLDRAIAIMERLPKLAATLYHLACLRSLRAGAFARPDSGRSGEPTEAAAHRGRIVAEVGNPGRISRPSPYEGRFQPRPDPFPPRLPAPDDGPGLPRSSLCRRARPRQDSPTLSRDGRFSPD